MCLVETSTGFCFSGLAVPLCETISHTTARESFLKHKQVHSMSFKSAFKLCLQFRWDESSYTIQLGLMNSSPSLILPCHPLQLFSLYCLIPQKPHDEAVAWTELISCNYSMRFFTVLHHCFLSPLLCPQKSLPRSAFLKSIPNSGSLPHLKASIISLKTSELQIRLPGFYFWLQLPAKAARSLLPTWRPGLRSQLPVSALPNHSIVSF